MQNPYDESGNIAWKATGEYDGVVFLGEKRYINPSTGEEIILYPSLEREALKFLRPPSQAYLDKHPEKTYGFCRPNLSHSLFPDSLVKASQKQGRRIRILFSENEKTLELDDSIFKRKCKIIPIKEGEICAISLT